MKEEKNDSESERFNFARDCLKAILLRLAPRAGDFSTPIPGVGIARRETAGFSEHRFERPLVSVLVNSLKKTFMGGGEYTMRAGQVLTVCADMPSSSKILEASPENPLLTFYFSLNQRIIKESLVEIKLPVSEEWRGGGVSVASADTDFMEAILRLATIIEKPDQIPARAELALRDLHLLLLLGPQGRVIRNFFGPGSFNNEIFAAIEYLRSNIDRVVCAKELARIANMSESTLYRYFKSLTGISPLQYHKKLRLHEGRRLILENNERASIAAYKTGYESVSQFSREYKKLFGKSPRQSRKE